MMERGDEPFSIRFVTADRARKTGGEILEWQNCRLSRPRRQGTGPRPAPNPARSAASHYENGTRNISVGQSTQVRTVHIWLILAVNGKKVVL